MFVTLNVEPTIEKLTYISYYSNDRGPNFEKPSYHRKWLTNSLTPQEMAHDLSRTLLPLYQRKWLTNSLIAQGNFANSLSAQMNVSRTLAAQENVS